MKNILLALLACLPFCLAAQSIVVEPNPSTLEILDFDPTDNWVEEVADAHISNMTGDQILMRWELDVQSDAPADWEYRVCDQNQCYTIGVESNWMPGVLEEPDTLSALEENSNLQLHVLPRGVGGTGTIHINLSTIDNPDDVLATAVFNVTATPLVSVTEVEKQLIQVFPNPTTDYFFLKNSEPVDELVIYNTLGKQVRRFDNVYEGQKYNLSDLPDGLYMVSMVSDEEGILKTTRISKRSLRP